MGSRPGRGLGPGGCGAWWTLVRRTYGSRRTLGGRGAFGFGGRRRGIPGWRRAEIEGRRRFAEGGGWGCGGRRGFGFGGWGRGSCGGGGHSCRCGGSCRCRSWGSSSGSSSSGSGGSAGFLFGAGLGACGSCGGGNFRFSRGGGRLRGRRGLLGSWHGMKTRSDRQSRLLDRGAIGDTRRNGALGSCSNRLGLQRKASGAPKTKSTNRARAKL
jgi:hypothetical protein